MPQIDSVKIIRSKRKTLCLQIMPDCSIVVRAPKLMPNLFIEQFIKSKHQWIIKKLSEQKNQNRFQESALYKDGDKILLLGEEYTIVTNPDIKKVNLSEGYLTVPEKENKEALIKWYKKKAKKLFTERTRALAGLNGFNPKKISINSARSRYGSCTSTGNINLTYRLLMAPESVINYVIIHELCHLKHQNHGKRYWNLVANLCPDYKENRKWLKINGYKMYI